jgi:hypothetical protein
MKQPEMDAIAKKNNYPAFVGDRTPVIQCSLVSILTEQYVSNDHTRNLYKSLIVEGNLYSTLVCGSAIRKLLGLVDS